MDRAELLRCMREAAGALAEFRRFIPIYCPEAVSHLEQALRHFDLAMALCRQSSGADRDEDDGHGDDDDDGDVPLNLRINW
jgi:hypothetical protein